MPTYVAQQGKAALFFHAISRAEQATNAPVERCGNFSNFTRLEIFRHCCGSVISGSRLPGRVSKHALDDFILCNLQMLRVQVLHTDHVQ